VKISVVIPAFNAERTLPQVLAAGCAALPPPFEVIVVNDGSTDSTATIAKSFPIHVIGLEQNIGAAAAKNRGAAAAGGEILYFTDADVVMTANAIALLQNRFQDPSVEGVVALLDENIPFSNWASQFKNLWMNFTYRRFTNVERIGLFYTSAAAMRRSTFLELGGFDENYQGASIAEDTEFGQRAWGKGKRIVLEPALRAVHLKQYTIGGVLSEDFKRAYALTMMRLRKRGKPFFTSVPFFYQLAVPTIWLALFAAVAALLLWSVWLTSTAALLFLAFYSLNAPLLWFLFKARGTLFALATILFLPFDVLVVGLGMAHAFTNFVRGRRY
jgi:glycosyltransferase involved in cell wall biosynthesis